jgi:type IV secretory pathway VirB3-like protein
MADGTLNWKRAFVVTIIAMMGLVCFLTVQRESITCDEVAHITAGMTYLQRNDVRMNMVHPPLMKLLAAIPLTTIGASAKYDDPSWDSLDQWGLGVASFDHWGTSSSTLLLLSRVPMIGITLLLGITVFFVSNNLFGPNAGILSLVVYASSPFFLAYGPLVLTDIGIALFSLLTVWTFASLWQCPDMKRATLFGLSFAGALLSKFSSGLLLPVLVIVGILFARRPPSRPYNLRKTIRFSVIGSGFAIFTVYLTYAILFRKTDTAWLLSYRYAHSPHPNLAMRALADLLTMHPLLKRLGSPVILYGLGVGGTLRGLSRPAYLLGKVYPHGTVAYFPALLLYKMTPGFLFLILLVVALVIWKLVYKRSPIIREPRVLHHTTAIGVLFAVFMTAAVLSPINIGVRHLSVPITALVVLVGLIVPLSDQLKHRGRLGVIVAVALSAGGCIYSATSAFPNYIAYFNEFTLGTPTYSIAIDSNLDWGQGLVLLNEFMHRHGIKTIVLDDSIESIPEMYMLNGLHEFQCDHGVPSGSQWVAIGASRLADLPDLTIGLSQRWGGCNYLLKYPHWVVAGGAMYVFLTDLSSPTSQVTSGVASQ